MCMANCKSRDYTCALEGGQQQKYVSLTASQKTNKCAYQHHKRVVHTRKSPESIVFDTAVESKMLEIVDNSNNSE